MKDHLPPLPAERTMLQRSIRAQLKHLRTLIDSWMMRLLRLFGLGHNTVSPAATLPTLPHAIPARAKVPKAVVQKHTSIQSKKPATPSAPIPGRSKPLPVREIPEEPIDETPSENLLKSKTPLMINGQEVYFVERDTDEDDTEVLLQTGAGLYRIGFGRLSLSGMLQRATREGQDIRFSGSGAFGVMTGEAFVALTEIERVLRTLQHSTGEHMDIDIVSFDKEASSTHRKARTLTIRFSRVKP